MADDCFRRAWRLGARDRNGDQAVVTDHAEADECFSRIAIVPTAGDEAIGAYANDGVSSEPHSAGVATLEKRVFVAADFRFDPMISSRAANTRAYACSLSAQVGSLVDSDEMLVLP